VVIDSSGNAGSSLAGYCAALGIRCSVYAPESASPAKLVQARAYGATVVSVPSSRSDTTRAAVEATRRAVYASHMWNPYFIAETQTFAFELVEQLGAAPAAAVFPLGAGTLLLGAYLGFASLLEAGLIEALPRLYGVQAAVFAPLLDAFERGGSLDDTTPSQPSLAEGILIAAPPRADAVVAAVRESGGSVLAVSEAEIAASFQRLAGRGVYVEPTSATAVAGLERLLEEVHPPLEGVVAVALTGTGLKAGAVAERLTSEGV
jgi:threonine synthase